MEQVNVMKPALGVHEECRARWSCHDLDHSVVMGVEVWGDSSMAASCSSWSPSCWGAPAQAAEKRGWELWFMVLRQNSYGSDPGMELCQKRNVCIIKSALEIGDQKNVILNLLPR